MKAKNNKAVLILGLGLVAAIIVVLIVLSKTSGFVISGNHGNKDTTSKITTTQRALSPDETTQGATHEVQKDYDSALTKTFVCDGENFGGEIIINAYDDMTFYEDDFKLIRCTLVSPSNKITYVEFENADTDENINILPNGASYTFSNPIEQGTWKMIIYGNSLTDTGTNAFLSVDYVSDVE